MNLSKYKIILAIGVVLLVYFFTIHFGLIKKLVGYNVPFVEEPQLSAIGSSSLSFLKLPDGFKVDIFAKDLENPRVITFDPNGNILTSETKAGRVILLEDKDKNGIAETKKIILSELNKPHGLAFYNSGKNTYLYVAETNQVTRLFMI